MATSKRTRASHFIGLATDLKRCFVRSSWSSSEYVAHWGFFFLGRLTNTLKFSVEFNKKIKNKKEACGRELIPAKHSADLQPLQKKSHEEFFPHELLMSFLMSYSWNTEFLMRIFVRNFRSSQVSPWGFQFLMSFLMRNCLSRGNWPTSSWGPHEETDFPRGPHEAFSTRNLIPHEYLMRFTVSNFFFTRKLAHFFMSCSWGFFHEGTLIP